MSISILPISAIVPTIGRPSQLQGALVSLQQQRHLPAELIVIDASSDGIARGTVEAWGEKIGSACRVKWLPAKQRGAAVQRLQGLKTSTQPFVWFFDDDIVLESHCLDRIWTALQKDPLLGGVNATIINQGYSDPGFLTRLLYRVVANGVTDLAGRCVGPAMNILPKDDDKFPAVVPVDWLNTTCTVYRREALPSPAFDSIFVDYSLMEDLALSLRVGRTWKLANARTARIYHDSQNAPYKTARVSARMELVNRHYIMSEILGSTNAKDLLHLLAFELFQVATPLSSARAWLGLPGVLVGKGEGLAAIVVAQLFDRLSLKHKEGESEVTS